jgi:hypothetical protein
MRRTITRRGLLAGIGGLAGAAVAGGLARAEHLLSSPRDGRPMAVGANYDDVRAETSFQAASPDTTVLSFHSEGAGAVRHSVEVGPDGIRAERHGHWSRQSVVIDGTVRATGGGAEAAAAGPMIVGEGDSLGVYGLARADGAGIRGRGAIGVEGVGPTGVRGIGEGGPGISASGRRGGVLAGDVAQLRLQPAASATHPLIGEAGDLFVDASGRLWFCRGGSDWHQVA